MYRFDIWEGLLNESRKGTVFHLYEKIFGHPPTESVVKKLESARNVLCILVFDAKNHAVGYKLGYEKQPDMYYSWLGGVLETHRRSGLASEMMRLQHQWAQQKGYTAISTKTRQHWENMFILNKRFGFEELRRYEKENGVVVIEMEKRLFGNKYL